LLVLRFFEENADESSDDDVNFEGVGGLAIGPMLSAASLLFIGTIEDGLIVDEAAIDVAGLVDDVRGARGVVGRGFELSLPAEPPALGMDDVDDAEDFLESILS
jgi:hypothetical protein